MEHRYSFLASFLRHARQSPVASLDLSDFRRQFFRARHLQTVSVAAVSVVVALVAVSAVTRARTAQHEWSGEAVAFSARRDLAPGAEITDDDLVQVMLPVALVPDNAVTAVTPGARARIHLSARTIVTATMLDDRPTYPASWRVVAVPPGLATPPVKPGDTVDLVAGVELLAERAVVVTVSPLSVAVPADRAPTVAAAVRMGDVSLLAR